MLSTTTSLKTLSRHWQDPYILTGKEKNSKYTTYMCFDNLFSLCSVVAQEKKDKPQSPTSPSVDDGEQGMCIYIYNISAVKPCLFSRCFHFQAQLP